ncbi:glycoside hydrolase family 13 protein [Limnochorda pilosa]|uniref:Cyclomaltodextrinase n=1 Tax=Limnochorda pilosa TaxID=1555112 RepID=A0A0K2SNU8_LIMPI|nr:glycoside hydrolase family 13 protein [Limnochorda pilosa]BAS28813.1 cyclomaltodextrinase [Limnochorda pilosa]
MTPLHRDAVLHRPELPYAYPGPGRSLVVRLRTGRGDAERVRVVYRDRYQPPSTDRARPMRRVGRDELFDYYQAELRVDPPRYRYWFVLDHPAGTLWYGEHGFFDDPPDQGAFEVPYVFDEDRIEAPEWWRDGVIYQIVPDRFAGPPEPPRSTPGEVLGWEDPPTHTGRYPGTLRGIREHLDHVEDLGANLLYLTPIFLSSAYHGYETTDYYQVDPHLGSLDDLKELVEAAHRRGMRVILDGVFNHCGPEFFAFQDVLEKGEASRYRDWFIVRRFPLQMYPEPTYETWASVARMPKLRTSNPEVQRYFVDVGRHWIREAGIDGWRLDVANEVSHGFWKVFRRGVREERPDAVLLGEIWHDPLPWLRGDELDSVTHYPFRRACLDFFALRRVGAARFDAQLARGRLSLPGPVHDALVTLLDSHDTARFRELAGGDSESQRLAVLFQMTYPGVPLVYYGDEVGLRGGEDPESRRPMVWDPDRWERELHQAYRRAIGLRREHPALRRGEVATFWVDAPAGGYLFGRRYEDERLAVALNNGFEELELDVPLPEGWARSEAAGAPDLLGGDPFRVEGGRLQGRLAPRSGAVLALP